MESTVPPSLPNLGGSRTDISTTVRRLRGSIADLLTWFGRGNGYEFVFLSRQLCSQVP